MRRKSVIISISVILIVLFGLIVYRGFRYTRGVPVSVEKKEKPVLEVPFIDIDIDLAKDISLEVWNRIPPKEIELNYQVTILPWGKSLISPIIVKAFHNKKFIFFYIRYKDETENRTISTNKFSDAVAIMFPLEDKVQPATLMMGFLGEVNIWQWKASQDKEYWLKTSAENKVYTDFYYPFEEKELFPVSKDVHRSAVNDLVAIRVGTITPKENQNVHGRGFWKDGYWNVIFKRSFEPPDEHSAKFVIGEKRLCAFAVWEGEKGDRGGRKSISDWVEVIIK